MMKSSLLAFAFFLLLIPPITGCREGNVAEGEDLDKYRYYLEITDPDRIGLTDDETAQEAVQRFTDFYQVYSTEVITGQIRSLYSEEIYFRDPFHEVEGIEATEAYFLRAAEAVADCRFDIQDISSHQGEYYFRWVMYLRLKRDGDNAPTETAGMSHIRFNREGMVIFHVDYWDPSIPVYGRIPVLRSLIGAVRKRI